ncbi:RNA methyltransferase [Imbroritus primus]|uniref:RNA methyltransferase n=1 Tax=Imbroritus primus TaxID=3058603 RepID=UPI003D161639
MNPDTPTSLASGPPDSAALARYPLSLCRFVLVETSHPGNVGSVARALKTMGLGLAPRSLVLVSPRDPDVLRHPEAVAMASGADDVLASACLVDHIDEALAGATLTVALSARPREFGPVRLAPREAVAQAVAQLQAPEACAAFIFGNERTGLPNEIVERCSLITHIPANPDYASLNLSQAVQLMAYELRLAVHGATAPATQDVGFQGVPATAEQIEGMFEHLEQALVEIGFLDPAQPKRLMPRLRRLLARTGLEAEEVNILRGIAKHILLHERRENGSR